jgi:hypothetical protein
MSDLPPMRVVRTRPRNAVTGVLSAALFLAPLYAVLIWWMVS